MALQMATSRQLLFLIHSRGSPASAVSASPNGPGTDSAKALRTDFAGLPVASAIHPASSPGSAVTHPGGLIQIAGSSASLSTSSRQSWANRQAICGSQPQIERWPQPPTLRGRRPIRVRAVSGPIADLLCPPPVYVIVDHATDTEPMLRSSGHSPSCCQSRYSVAPGTLAVFEPLRNSAHLGSLRRWRAGPDWAAWLD